MRLTDDRLCDYPFIYIIEPGGLSFSRGRRHRAAPLSAQWRLLDGRRFLGRHASYENFLEQMKARVS